MLFYFKFLQLLSKLALTRIFKMLSMKSADELLDEWFPGDDVTLAKHLVDRCKNQPGLVSATHQQLASELGTAREVVSRQLKVFEKQAWIAVHRGSVEVLQPRAFVCLTGTTMAGTIIRFVGNSGYFEVENGRKTESIQFAYH